MTTITGSTAEHATRVQRVRLRVTDLTDRVERIDTLVLGLAVGIAAFGPGLWFALVFLAPYVAVQLGLWLLFRTRTK